MRPVVTAVGLFIGLSVSHTMSPAERLKRSSCHLLWGLGWAQGTIYCTVVQIPIGRGNFEGNGRIIVNYRDTLRSSVKKRLNRSICHLSSGPKDAQVQSYSPSGANVPSWEYTLPPPGEYNWTIRLRRRCALSQITLPLVIFGHAHLHSRTGSRALQAEYCVVGIPHNTAI